MALPTDQTSTLIVTEALKAAKIPSPTAGQLTRATDEWLRRALQRIVKRTQILLFQKTANDVISPYINRIAAPSDFDTEVSINVMTGSNKGTLVSSTTTTLTLAADEDVTASFIKGKKIAITSGSIKSTVATVTNYNESTKVATISPTLTTLPSTDTYMILDTSTPLLRIPEGSFPNLPNIGIPTRYHIYGKTPNKEIHLDNTIDDTVQVFAVLQIRYIVYSHKVDLTDARMISIYNEFHSELTQGVFAEALRDKDDSRYSAEFQRFEKYISDYLAKENREQVRRVQFFNGN